MERTPPFGGDRIGRTPIRERNPPPFLTENFVSGSEFDTPPLEDRSHSQGPPPASGGGITLGSGLPPLPSNNSHFREAGLRNLLENRDREAVGRAEEPLTRNQSQDQDLTVEDLAQSQSIHYKRGLEPGFDTSTPAAGKSRSAPAFQAGGLSPENLRTRQRTEPKALPFAMAGASGSYIDPGDHWGLWDNADEISRLFYKHAPDNFVDMFRLATQNSISSLARSLRVEKPEHPDWPPTSWIEEDFDTTRSLRNLIAYITMLSVVLERNVEPFEIVEDQYNASQKMMAPGGAVLIKAQIKRVANEKTAMENLGDKILSRWGELLGISNEVIKDYVTSGKLPEKEKSKPPRRVSSENGHDEEEREQREKGLNRPPPSTHGVEPQTPQPAGQKEVKKFLSSAQVLLNSMQKRNAPPPPSRAVASAGVTLNPFGDNELEENEVPGGGGGARGGANQSLRDKLEETLAKAPLLKLPKTPNRGNERLVMAGGAGDPFDNGPPDDENDGDRSESGLPRRWPAGTGGGGGGQPGGSGGGGGGRPPNGTGGGDGSRRPNAAQGRSTANTDNDRDRVGNEGIAVILEAVMDGMERILTEASKSKGGGILRTPQTRPEKLPREGSNPLKFLEWRANLDLFRKAAKWNDETVMTQLKLTDEIITNRKIRNSIMACGTLEECYRMIGNWFGDINANLEILKTRIAGRGYVVPNLKSGANPVRRAIIERVDDICEAITTKVRFFPDDRMMRKHPGAPPSGGPLDAILREGMRGQESRKKIIEV